jgi:chaperonin GroES
LGWGHLAKSLNEAINTSLNQMFDAGTLQNAGGGFIGTSLSLHSGPINFQVGRYVPVNNKGQNIRDSVFPMPFAGPSQVLFNLLELLLGAAKQITGTQDILAGDLAKADASPTTVLALIEQGSKMYTSITKRLYRAMKSEYQKLYTLNRKHLTEAAHYRVGDEFLEVTPDDYRLGGGVEPIADPTMVTDMQRLGRAQILMTLKDDPMVNGMEVRRRFFEYCGIDRIDEILTPPNPLPAQMALQKAQAELGEFRSLIQKNTAQALLFMAQARSASSDPEAQMAEHLLDMIRLHLEALNTTVKAADVEAKSHGKQDMSETKADARSAAITTRPAAALAGANTGSVQPVAAQPNVAPVLPVPDGGGAGLPGQGGGGLA